MKNAVLLICLLAGITAFGQSGSGFGIKGGLNFSSTGDLNFDNVQNIGSDTKTGFHIGAFGKFGGDGLFYLRPELVYTQVRSAYGFENQNSDFTMHKIDVPVLVGLNIIGPLHIFAGPAFQWILDTELDNVNLGDLDSDVTVGYNLGIGLNLGSFGFDLRYDNSFSSNDASFTDEVFSNTVLDTRPSQVILSLSYMF